MPVNPAQPDTSEDLYCFTFEEYRALEESSELKFEWIDGRIYPFSSSEPLSREEYSEVLHSTQSPAKFVNMAGASTRHNRITMTVSRLLGNQLHGKPCEPFGSDQRIKIPTTGLRAFPDIQVACEPIEYDDALPYTIVNPVVIIEVLSSSTERNDRTRKWFHYQQLESLSDYIMIAQDERLVEHYTRHEGGGWNYRIFENEGEVLLASIDCKLSLADIYERVEI